MYIFTKGRITFLTKISICIFLIYCLLRVESAERRKRGRNSVVPSGSSSSRKERKYRIRLRSQGRYHPYSNNRNETERADSESDIDEPSTSSLVREIPALSRQETNTSRTVFYETRNRRRLKETTRDRNASIDSNSSEGSVSHDDTIPVLDNTNDESELETDDEEETEDLNTENLNTENLNTDNLDYQALDAMLYNVLGERDYMSLFNQLSHLLNGFFNYNNEIRLSSEDLIRRLNEYITENVQIPLENLSLDDHIDIVTVLTYTDENEEPSSNPTNDQEDSTTSDRQRYDVVLSSYILERTENGEH